MNIITHIIEALTTVADDQARIAGDTDQPIETREVASTHYGSLVLVLHALHEARKAVLKDELDALDALLKEAAPPGANPKLHPSMQPRLHVVKEDTHDQDTGR